MEGKEITVVLKTIGGTGGANAEESGEQKVSTESSAKDKSVAKSVYGALAMQAANAAINEMTAWISYEVNKYLTLNDDYIGQRNLQIAMQAVNWGTSAASTIGSTAMMGSAAGPVGAVIGAIVGAGMVAARTARQNAQAQEQQQIRLNLMNAQLSYTRSRIGWSLQAASIGEDL